MNETKKIEVKGKTYDLTDLDTLNVREKMTIDVKPAMSQSGARLLSSI